VLGVILDEQLTRGNKVCYNIVQQEQQSDTSIVSLTERQLR